MFRADSETRPESEERIRLGQIKMSFNKETHYASGFVCNIFHRRYILHCRHIYNWGLTRNISYITCKYVDYLCTCTTVRAWLQLSSSCYYQTESYGKLRSLLLDILYGTKNFQTKCCMFFISHISSHKTNLTGNNVALTCQTWSFAVPLFLTAAN